MKPLRDYFEPVISLQEATPPHWTMGCWSANGYSEWHRDDGHTVVIETGSSDPIHVRVTLTSADVFTPRRRLRAWRRAGQAAVARALITFVQWRLQKLRAAESASETAP